VKSKPISVDQDSDCDSSHHSHHKVCPKNRKESYDNLKDNATIKQPRYLQDTSDNNSMKTELDLPPIHQREYLSALDRQQRTPKNRSNSSPLIQAKYQRHQSENKTELADLGTVEDSNISENSMDETLAEKSSLEIAATGTNALSSVENSQEANFSTNQHLPLNPTMNKIFSIKSQFKQNSNNNSNDEEGPTLQTCKINLTPPLTLSTSAINENDNSNDMNNALSISETADNNSKLLDSRIELHKYGIPSEDINEAELDKVI